ncbi:MAG: CDP-alcohol phosphatidyltransferase family protein [Eggerthellaceae bacterium]|nr:CDP-alcohol phosphatidyltransferase family protein [Eggerthellaceae bacterium]
MLANSITATRIAASAAMLASCPADPAFWLLYTWCGASDLIDGPIARRLGEESAFGARLDSAADLAFAIACCLSLLAECNLATWLIVTIAVLAIAKALFYALARDKGRDLHSKENKAAGLATFITLPVLFLTSLSVAALPACILAAYSILQEGRVAFAR